MEFIGRGKGVQVFCLSGGYGHKVNLYVLDHFRHSGNLLSVKNFISGYDTQVTVKACLPLVTCTTSIWPY